MKLSNFTVVVILVVALLVFMSGFVVGRKDFQPKTVTEKIYGFPEGVTLQKACDDFYVWYAEDLKERAKQKAEDWRRGYEEGYRAK